MRISDWSSDVCSSDLLRLIVHLSRYTGESTADAGMSRLLGDTSSRRVLDMDVPIITLPVAPGRNLAVLLEAAARLHILRAKGIDPAHALIARHTRHLERRDLQIMPFPSPGTQPSHSRAY